MQQKLQNKTKKGRSLNVKLNKTKDTKHSEALDEVVVKQDYHIYNLQLEAIIEKDARKLSEDNCLLIHVHDKNIFSTFNIQ